MRGIALMGLAFMLSGCASATVHDYCVRHGESYSTYGECYSEVSENHANWSVGKKIATGIGMVLGGAGKGSQRSSAATIQPPASCQSVAYGNSVDTTCY